jgi:hypothetical protein
MVGAHAPPTSGCHTFEAPGLEDQGAHWSGTGRDITPAGAEGSESLVGQVEQLVDRALRPGIGLVQLRVLPEQQQGRLKGLEPRTDPRGVRLGNGAMTGAERPSAGPLRPFTGDLEPVESDVCNIPRVRRGPQFLVAASGTPN